MQIKDAILAITVVKLGTELPLANLEANPRPLLDHTKARLAGLELRKRSQMQTMKDCH